MSNKGSFQRRSFSGRDVTDVSTLADEAEAPEVVAASRKAVTSAAIMGAVGVLALFGSFFVDTSTVSSDDATEIRALQSQAQQLEKTEQDLPTAEEAQQAIDRAVAMSAEVATLQNDYSILTGRADENGVVDTDLTKATARALTPYFDRNIDAALLEPWYLLGSDASVPVGIGVPETFDSGFVWRANVPAVIDPDGTLRVSWVAVEKETAGDREPEVLAWATAEFDMTRGVFTDLKTGRTTTGEVLMAGGDEE